MVEIVIAHPESPPFEVELVVLEEDRWLVLSTASTATTEREETETLVRSMEMAALPETGELLIRGNRARAIVHDLDRDPTTDKAIIVRLLERTFEYCRNEGIRSVAIQPLGSVHGQLTTAAFLRLLDDAASHRCVQQIWVIR